MRMKLDEFDQKILAELEEDARISIQNLARKVGLKRTTAGYRLNKLIESGVLRFACIADADVLEYQIPLGIGINVSPGKTEVVAKALAELPAVKVVNLVAGRYGIFAWALLKDRRDLTGFLTEDLGRIQDITSLESLLAFNWIRESWRFFNPLPEQVVKDPDTNLDEVDLALIAAVQGDPRGTITDLAEACGCSKPVARARLESLLDGRVIRVVSVLDPATLGYEIEALVLVKTTPELIQVVADMLSLQNIVRHVSLTTGNWQVLAAVQFRDNAHMHDYLSETLAAAPGVMEYEVLQITKTLKFSMSFVDIL